MVSLTDLFNPTFLTFLGILLLAIALLVLYFESKFRDQNHKISSMLSLVSSLAEELNSNKMIINHLSMMGAGNLQSVTSQNIGKQYEKNNNLEQNGNVELIDVSDDDDDDDVDDDDDDDENNDDDTTDSDNEETHDLNLEETTVIQIGETLGVKVLKINISEYNDDIDDDDDDVEDELDSNLGNVDDLDEIACSDTASSKSEIEGNNTEEFLSLECSNTDELENLVFNNNNFSGETVPLFDLKSINISSLEEESKEVIDFKKMSLPKLRSIVSEKGLSTEAAKLKKIDLLKLLEVE
jgi:hypothetical protein